MRKLIVIIFSIVAAVLVYAADVVIGRTGQGVTWSSNAGNNLVAVFASPVTHIAKAYGITCWEDGSWKPSTWVFEGSNNGSTWTGIGGETGVTWSASFETKQYVVTNSTSYDYYRLTVTDTPGNTYCQIIEFWIYDESLDPITPTMTSDTEPSGHCTASSILPGYNPYLAFDQKTTANGWHSTDQGEPFYIQYQF